jgi:hypothetical protein
MPDFIRDEEHPDWFIGMVAAGLINVVDNIMVTTLAYTAEHLDDDGTLSNVTRGEDLAIIIQVAPDGDEAARIIFAIPPEGGLALAQMILRRFPEIMVRAAVEEAMADPGETISFDRPALPPSEEGRAWITQQLDKRGQHNG